MTRPAPGTEPPAPGIFPVSDHLSAAEEQPGYAGGGTDGKSNEDRPQGDVADHE